MSQITIYIEPKHGGAEAIYFQTMLLDMYSGWLNTAEIRFSTREQERILEISIEDDRFDLFSSEAGMHRLVRIPPHDLNSRRHLSFCLVTVASEAHGRTETEDPRRTVTLDPHQVIQDEQTGLEVRGDRVDEVLGGDIGLINPLFWA